MWPNFPFPVIFFNEGITAVTLKFEFSVLVRDLWAQLDAHPLPEQGTRPFAVLRKEEAWTI